MTLGPLAILLTLASALAWSLYDVTRKGLAQKALPLHLGVWLALGQVPLLGLWAATTGPVALPPASWAPGLLSVGLNVLALLWFLQALRLSPLSLTIPLLSFCPVLSTLFAWILRHQTPTRWQFLGALLVMAGALVLGFRARNWPGLRTYLREPGVWRMAGTALLWSTTALVDQAALQRGAGYWYAPALSLGVGAALALVVLASGEGRGLLASGRALSRHPVLLSLAVLAGGLALAIQLEALRVAPVGFVETIKRGLGMIGAVLAGRVFFREPLGLPKFAAVALMTAGVGLVMAL